MTNRLIISNPRLNNTNDELVDIITGVQNTQKLILKPEKASRSRRVGHAGLQTPQGESGANPKTPLLIALILLCKSDRKEAHRYKLNTVKSLI